MNEIWVYGYELKVGDEVISWKVDPGDHREHHPSNGAKWVVTEVTKDDAKYSSNGGPPEYTFLWKENKRTFFRVKRGASKPTAATAKKVIDEYPEHCTRCGESAYVGAFEVVHRDEARAKGCPARRP